MGRRRLSDLPDDLLRRILYFAPLKEAASTSALARRWRTLWLSSGAVNIDSRNYDHLEDDAKRDAFDHHAAEAVYGRRLWPIKKLAFRYMEGENEDDDSLSYQVYLQVGELMGLLSAPGACHVEDLCVGLFFGPCPDEPNSLYGLSIGTLPSAASLRVLHLSKVMDFCPQGPGSSLSPYPRLTEARLHFCYVSLGILQAFVDAAPMLGTLEVRAVQLCLFQDSQYPPAPRSLRLRLPRVTDLVLDDFYCWGPEGRNTMEIQEPLLRRFAYEGHVRALYLEPPPEMMARVNLRFKVPALLVHPDDDG
ncbi:hypothetical protein BRADI_5g23490v3, partial [Brachypodium distachyon]